MTGKVSSRQITLMIVLSRISDMGVFLPVLTAGNARQDAWVSVIIGSLAGIVIGLIIAGLTTRLGDLSFGLGVKRLLGPKLGTAAGLMVGLFLYFIVLFVTRLFSLLAGIYMLPNSPTWIVSGALLITAIYGALTGPDSLGRAAELLITPVGIAIVAALLLLVTGGRDILDWGLLQPVLARGMGPVLEGAIMPAFWYSISTGITLALGKTCLDRHNLGKAVTRAVIASGIILFFIALAVIVSIGPESASEQLSPPLTMARTVFFRGIIERADIVFITIWILGTSFDISILLLSASIILSDTIKKNTAPVIIFLGVIGIVVTSLNFNNVFDFRQLFRPIPEAIVILIIYILTIGSIYIVSMVRRRKIANVK